MTSRARQDTCDLCGGDSCVCEVELVEAVREHWCRDCYMRRWIEQHRDCACTRAGLPPGYNVECNEHEVAQ